MATPPEVTVTMIGAAGCGKTTYLHGMYAMLSAGLADYVLICDDLDLDLDLTEQWDALRESGELPPPTGDRPKRYPFVFRSGLETILRFSWDDYRGGAMSDKIADEAALDATELHRRLIASDSIYLVLDGAALTEPATPSRLNRLRGSTTMARRMNALVQRTPTERGAHPTPSLVVLVTKADLIRAAHPGTASAALTEMVADTARELLPVCFQEGLNTLVCPVQIGDFAGATQASVDPGTVNPKELHLPLVFSFLRYLGAHVERTSDSIDALRSRAASQRGSADALEGSWRGLFQGGEVSRLKVAAGQADRSAKELLVELAAQQRRLAMLGDALDVAVREKRVAAFEDGKRLS